MFCNYIKLFNKDFILFFYAVCSGLFCMCECDNCTIYYVFILEKICSSILCASCVNFYNKTIQVEKLCHPYKQFIERKEKKG